MTQIFLHSVFNVALVILVVVVVAVAVAVTVAGVAGVAVVVFNPFAAKTLPDMSFFFERC